MPSEKAREGNRRRVQRWRVKNREKYNAYMRGRREHAKPLPGVPAGSDENPPVVLHTDNVPEPPA